MANTSISYELHSLIEEAKLNNPEIKLAKARYEAATKRISGFRYLMEPWLMAEFNADMRSYSLLQEVPFPTKLATRSQLSQHHLRFKYHSPKRKRDKILHCW